MRALLPLLLLAACAVPKWDRVRSWAIQLQGLEREGAIDALDREPVDMVVLEATRTVKGQEGFPTRELVKRLSAKKVCLAYVNVGQAEDYRTYWTGAWRGPGEPSFVLGADPDGWAGNYPVACWDPRWRRELWGGAGALVDLAIEDGFDGVLCDWVLGYEDATVASAARRAGVDPARAMAELLRDLRVYARARRPGFLVIAQNGIGLPERVPECFAWIDGYTQESLSFMGKAGAAWEDAEAGDLAIPAEGDWSTAALSERIAGLRARGARVFTLDYAREPGNVALALRRSRALGCVPAVSLSPLDRLR